MTNRVAELRELMREGKRVDREDLPEELLLLEECVRLHPAEYAVKLTCLERELKRTLNRFNHYKARIDEVIETFGIQSCINDVEDLKKSLHKFVYSQQIQTLENLIENHATTVGQRGASGPFKIVEVEYIKAELDKLRQELNAG